MFEMTGENGLFGCHILIFAWEAMWELSQNQSGHWHWGHSVSQCLYICMPLLFWLKHISVIHGPYLDGVFLVCHPASKALSMLPVVAIVGHMPLSLSLYLCFILDPSFSF
ncbi:hypothetical protein V6N12_008815 [Hibiscus sabdariffa]|uniref:Uncharacterized protein n=2 Tax=Hibiscus sabdariffa TaxID=183260 RepID=A0ABR2C3V1_9ROSI